MVTIRQFTRGVSRAMRAVERESQHQKRQQFLHQQATAKGAMLDAAADAAAQYANVIDLLTGCHRIHFARRDWSRFATVPAPGDPPFDDRRERVAAAELASYQPTWIDKLLRRASARRKRLEAAMRDARCTDMAAHSAARAHARTARSDLAFGQSVVELRPEELIEAIRRYATLDEAAIEAVNILVHGNRVIAVVDGFEVDDMPAAATTLLRSGKASTKPLTRGKLLELHCDTICSSAIRVATELLAVLPIEAVEILMQGDLLDRASGHIETWPVLYARVTAQGLEKVNLMRASATPLAEHLGAHFAWTPRDGFRPLDLSEFDLPNGVTAPAGH